MKAESIRLKNFKKYESKEYKLHEIDLFCGPNGSGKSSVQQAITFALQGYVPEVDRKNEGILKLSRNGSDIESAIEFDNDVMVRRSLQQESRSIKEDLEVLPMDANCTKLADKNSRIVELTGIDSISLNFKEFLSMKNADKNQYINSIITSDWNKLKVKEYLGVKLKEEMEASEDMKELLNEVMKQYSKESSAEEGVKNMLAYLKVKKENYNSELKKQNGGVQSIGELKNQMVETDRGIEVVKEEIGTIDVQIIEIEKQFVKAENVNKERFKIDQKIQNAKKAFDKLNDDLSKMIESVHLQMDDQADRDFQGESDLLNAQLQQQENLLKKLTDELNTIKDKGTDIRARFDEKFNLFQKIEEVKGHCALDASLPCSQDFNNIKSTMVPEMEGLKADRNKVAAEYREINSKVMMAQAEVDNLKNKKDKLNSDLIKRNNQITVSNSIKNLQMQITQKRDEMRQLEAEKSNIQTVDISVEQLKKKGLVNRKNELKIVLKNKEEARTAMTLLEQTLLSREKTSRMVEHIKSIDKVIGPKGLQGLMVMSGITPLQEEVNSIFEKMGVDFKLYIKTGSKNFQFGIQTEGTERVFEGMSSGEQLMLTITLMAAIQKRRNANFKLCLIDRFETIDEFNRKRIVGALQQLGGEYFDNVIIAGDMTSEEFQGMDGINIYDFYARDSKAEPQPSLFDMLGSKAI